MTRSTVVARLRTTLPLTVLLLVIAIVATALHRHGQSWGDDYALYIRQGRSLVDGNVGQVIADNHFNVSNAAKPGFSPYVYPWVFPILLAPFTRLWGLDFDKLKLVEVACWCIFVAGFWAVVRRRMNQWLAILLATAVGLSLTYLRHTDAILSELPYMALVGITLWWMDRIRRPSAVPRTADSAVPSASEATARVAWDAIDRNRLVVLGLLLMLVFNTRREGLALLPAVIAAQAAGLGRARLRFGAWSAIDWRRLAVPHVTFAVSVVVLQLMLPSALAPEYDGAGLAQTWRKLRGPFQESVTGQLGLGHVAGWVRLVLALVVVAGLVVRLRRHLADDVALAVFAAGSLVIAGMIPADSSRYTMAITPFLLYFGVQAFASITPSPRLWSTALGAVAAASVLVVNVVDIPSAVSDARQFDDDGRTQWGPDDPTVPPMFAAVRQYTHQDEVVAFFKGRAMTLYTDRRAVQSKDLDVIVERADWFVMRRAEMAGQPNLTDEQAAAAGLVQTWSDPTWILWHVRRADGVDPATLGG